MKIHYKSGRKEKVDDDFHNDFVSYVFRDEEVIYIEDPKNVLCDCEKCHRFYKNCGNISSKQDVEIFDDEEYIVIPRRVVESLPLPIKKLLNSLLYTISRVFDYKSKNQYYVILKDEEGKEIVDPLSKYDKSL